ncbi:MAG: hypothetical protein GEU81_06640 [Nitriliruptorales bacterium]|nr:hypothetical protein [Nitriliruptorales bacterium]
MMSDPPPGEPGGFDPRMFSQVPLFRELAKIMAWRGGPVNWDLAQQTASSVIASNQGADERALPRGDRDDEELRQAVTVAELWLDSVTDLPGIQGPVRAMDTEEWTRLAASSSGLGLYVEPIAEGMGSALSGNLPEELRSMMDPGAQGNDILSGMLGPMGAMLYGLQVGTVAGHLAGQLLGTYDLGVPTGEPRTIGTVGSTAQRLAAEYGFDPTEFRYWLALREAAHRRQFAGVSWLRPHLADLIRRFASAADFDPTQLMESFGGMGLDPGQLSDPSRIQEALEGPDAFRIEPTAEQREVLAQLQALVAFTEAWVDTVVRSAAGDKLTSLPRIEEAIRRRRAEKGAGEQFLEQLIGLDLKPSDVRAGQAFCDAVIAARGQAGLDRVWRGAEHLPSPAELLEPSRWLIRLATDEVEADLGHDPIDLDIPDDLAGLDDRDDTDH